MTNDDAGSTWVGAAKLTPNAGSQPADWYDIASTTYPEIISFKVKSTFTNGMTHLSPTSVLTVFCDNDYVITEVTAVTNPQFVPHDILTSGY